MTDYAQTTATDPTWTWWMTTAAAAAVRMRNLRHDHLQQTANGDGSGGSDVDDECAGPGGKRQRFGHADDEYWPVVFDHRAVLLPKQRQPQDEDDVAAAGPLDLSVKATLVDGPRVRKTDSGAGCADDGYMTAAVTPEKRPVASPCANRGGKSSKKTAGGTVAVTTAVKAATRKLLPQLMLDRHRVDRSSPVSGTIIVPATPLEVPTAAKRLSSRSSSSSSPPPLSLSSPPYADGSDGQEEYDGGDIDPEFNVVVATDEARRQIDSIPNALGPYRCRLCSVRYADAFALARHRCRCIVHVRYTCPECDKVFQCPANLASHRRWHGTAGTAKTAAVKPPGVNRSNKNGSGDNGDKPAVNAAPNNVNDTTVNDNNTAVNETTVNVNDGADGVGGTTVPVITASGFKKNMLQRAVQAAAVAANNNNNNNDDDKNKNNDIAK